MMKRRAFFLTVGLLALLGAFLVLYATPEGLGLSDDSIGYIAGARSLLSGDGYREAYLASNGYVTHFPPVFSLALAFMGLSGMDPLRAARFLLAFLYGANAFLLGVLGWRMTQSRAAGFALALLFVLNDSLFNVHIVAMSEPLYIFFTLAAFLTFREWSEQPSRSLLAAVGVLTSLAYLTRYAGLALFATFLAALILLPAGWKQRMSGAAIFLAAFLPPALAWAFRNWRVAENATNRVLVYHPLTQEHFATFVYNFSRFLLPVESLRRALVVGGGTAFFVFVGILASALVGWLAFKSFKKFFQPASETPEILSFVNGLYVFGYLASVVSSMLFFDQATKFKLRILAPVYVALLILTVYFGVQLWNGRKKILQGLVVAAFLLAVVLSAGRTYQSARALHAGGGQGFASFQWYDSKAMKFLAALPPQTRIYTNQPGAVYLYAKHPAYVLPDLVDSVTGLPRGNFEEGAALLQKDVLSGQAVLALFNVGAESVETQKVYERIAAGLHLALQTQGDRIYTAQP